MKKITKASEFHSLTIRIKSRKLKLSKDTDGILKRNVGVCLILNLRRFCLFLRGRPLPTFHYILRRLEKGPCGKERQPEDDKAVFIS